MVPRTKEELSKLVTDTTIETYEELTPQLIQLIDQTKHNDKLTEAQKQDEISLHLLGYVKSCTNEIIIDVLAEILGLDQIWTAVIPAVHLILLPLRYPPRSAA